MQVQSVAGTGDNPYTNALVAVKWLGSTLTYGFPTLSQYTGYDPGEETSQNFEVLAPAQQGAVSAALAMVSTFTNLTFTELAGADAGNAELRFGQSDTADIAFGYYPDPSPLGGDAWFNNSKNLFDAPVLGNYAFFSFMHEIGHTLGLGHPHESAQPMPLDRDWIGYTVMSYRSTQGGGLGYFGSYFPQSYMMEDIRALQLMYGANYGYQAGNTTYSFNPANGEMSINGVGQGVPASNRLYRTLWDGGGVDTLDFSNFVGIQAQTIDLRPGVLNTLNIGSHSDFLAMAHLVNSDPRALIESAIGTSGPDTIYGNDAANNLAGGPGNDFLYGYLGNDTLAGNAGADFLYGGDGDDALTGGGDVDRLYGDAGNDLIQAGSDRIIAEGGTGNDTMLGGGSSDELHGQDGADVMHGAGGGDLLSGGAGDDLLFGDAGDDSLFGGDGADTLTGGDGSDTYTIDEYDAVVELPGQGSDRVSVTTSYVLPANVENLDVLGVNTALSLTGNDLDNIIRATSGNDIITGGLGWDSLYGYAGADRFVFTASDALSSSLDRLEDFATGLDRIDLTQIAVTDIAFSVVGDYNRVTVAVSPFNRIYIDVRGAVTLQDIITAAIGQVFTGGPGADMLDGTSGNDTFYGGEGSDRMNGLGGNDAYYVDTQSDIVIEAPGGGTDRLLSSASYALRAGTEVERLEPVTLSGSEPLNFYGNEFAQALFGNSGSNILDGGGGNDTLQGLGGADFLNGGAGADAMYGGAGDDTYYIDDANDRIFEIAGEGSDRVAPGVDYTMPESADVELIEALNYSDTGALNLGGSDTANTVSGNLGANVLRGFGGNDRLFGYAGSDRLDGGTGDDMMAGGTGDDTYYVDSTGDRIFEYSAEGFDRVAAIVSIALPDDAEIELLEAINFASTAPIDLGGSIFNNTIVGSAGANILHGWGGNDTLFGYGGNDFLSGDSGADIMDGGTGDDTIYVDDAADVVIERAGEGTDRVATLISYTLAAGASVEVLDALDMGSGSALALIGNEIGNTITGNAGANVLDGKLGSDTLTGLGGADQFRFSTAPGSGNSDIITDFTPGSDKIALDHAIFTRFNPGTLGAGSFRIGSAAQDGDDFIIYDNATGALSYDADGNGAGAAVQFASLFMQPTLTAADFLIL